jgi:anti-anti-sigma factor
VEITVKQQEGVSVVSVAGKLDTLCAPDFQGKLLELIGLGEKIIVLDFMGLQYVSSAGLRSILIGAKKAKSCGGRLCCCGLQPVVKKVFEVSGFSEMIPVFETHQEALEKL